jgi:hypothetical protein
MILPIIPRSDIVFLVGYAGNEDYYVYCSGFRGWRKTKAVGDPIIMKRTRHYVKGEGVDEPRVEGWRPDSAVPPRGAAGAWRGG